MSDVVVAKPTLPELHALITRAQTCMENASTPDEARYWWGVMKAAIEERNEARNQQRGTP